MSNMIVTLTGPSCAGKSTLEGMMRDQLGFENVISTTTRPKREGDVDGVAYHFISKSKFERLVSQCGFVEYVDFNGNYYGISKKEVDRVFATGKNVVAVVEPDGMEQIRAYAKVNGIRHFAVFVNNPPKVIADRFLNRFVKEVAVNMNGNLAKSIATYSSRLGAMLSTEVSWVRDATLGYDRYDFILANFDEYNQAEVIKAMSKLQETSTV